jgi:hypothetical protein
MRGKNRALEKTSDGSRGALALNRQIDWASGHHTSTKRPIIPACPARTVVDGCRGVVLSCTGGYNTPLARLPWADLAASVARVSRKIEDAELHYFLTPDVAGGGMAAWRVGAGRGSLG